MNTKAKTVYKIRIKKGDIVIVRSGKYKGKTGKVVTTHPSLNKVTVEGINIVKKHVKPNPMQGTTGGIIEKTMPIHISNVALFCPKCAKKTKPVVKSADGKRTRVCKTCGDAIQSTT